MQSSLVEDDPIEILVGGEHVDELVGLHKQRNKDSPVSTSGWATGVIGLLAAFELATSFSHSAMIRVGLTSPKLMFPDVN